MGSRTMTVTAILTAVLVVAVAFIAAYRTGTFKITLDDLQVLYERPASQYVNIDGVDLHYEDHGSGPVLVLLHGSYSSLRTWDPLVARLKDRYRIISWDQPGMGLSGVVSEEDFPDGSSLHLVLHTLLHHLNVKGKISFIATSSGGTIATRYAVTWPEKVDKLVISNAPSAPVNIPRSARPPLVRSYMWLCDDILRHRTPGFWRAYYEYLWGEPDRLTEDLLHKYYDYNRRRPEPFARALIAASGSDSIERLGGVTHPTLLIWGMDDPVLPPAMLDQIDERMSSAPKTIVTLDNVGHYPILEVPDVFTDEVIAYLEAPGS
jgi:pimeloyl-ACP methyl ester carboxylesterase